jgi:hypothetical protein
MTPAVADDYCTFKGGVAAPTKTGSRVHISWPGASLSIGAGEMRLRGRGPLRWAFREAVADPHLAHAAAVRGHFLMGGVVISLPKGEQWLFWTWKPQEVLSALRRNGAEIAAGVRWVKWGDIMGY